MTEPKIERHAPYTAVHSGVRQQLIDAVQIDLDRAVVRPP